jgi:hypothetical protein
MKRRLGAVGDVRLDLNATCFQTDEQARVDRSKHALTLFGNQRSASPAC